MFFRPPEPDIDLLNPFTGDLLGREELANGLTQIVRKTPGPLVININGKWGTGKTHFLRRWKALLDRDKHPTIYLNVWEHEYHGTPLVSLIGEMNEAISGFDILPGKKGAARKHMKKVQVLGASVLRNGLPVAVRIATAGLVDSEAVRELMGDSANIGGAVADVAQKVAEEQIRHYKAAKKEMTDFKDRLEKYAEKVAGDGTEDEDQPRAEEDGGEGENNQGGRFRPLVVILDELDRCRPTYAIELLEHIKHLFDVPNLVFVVGIDREQVCHSVRCVYGAEMNADGYLRRFYDVEMNLPNLTGDQITQQLMGRFDFDGLFANRRGPKTQHDRGNFTEVLFALFPALELNPREQMKCLTQLAISVAVTPPNRLIFPILTGVLIAVKIKDHDLYRNYVSGRCGSAKVFELIKKTPVGKEFMESDASIWMEAFFEYADHVRPTEDTLTSQYAKAINDPDTSEELRARMTIKLKAVQGLNFDIRGDLLKYVSNKIDLSAQFSGAGWRPP